MQEIQLNWGKHPQLKFQDAHEYYRTLGHLTNSDAYSISYEYNQKNGSYSDACRIHILSSACNIPEALKDKETTNGRINCNEYIDNLSKHHNFVLSGNMYSRIFEDVQATVPEEYLSDFIAGYNEAVTRSSSKKVCYIAEAIDVSEKELKESTQPTASKAKSSCTKHKKGKRDYIKQYINDFEIGEAGENLVIKYEESIIKKAQSNNQIPQNIVVKWVSRIDDSAGYDARMLDGYDDPSNYPFISFMNEWLDEVHRHKIQETTYLGYKGRVNGNMTKFFGEKVTLADLKPRSIHAFYDYLRSIGDNEQTVLHYHNLLHSMFEYAIRQEIFEYNPMQRVERPTVKRYAASFYSVEEVQTLLAFAKDDPLYIPIIFAVYCGLRRSEALGMAWSNIDFEKDKMFVKQKVVEISRNGKKHIKISEDLKTESSRRVFALHPDVKKILLEHKERQEMYRKQFGRSYSKKYLDMVCVDQLGDLIRPNFVTEHFDIFLKKHGMRKIRFHDLRHTCASLLVALGENMKVIQAYMGHSTMSITADIYSHLDVSATSVASMKLGSFIGNKDE